jgi:immunity protein 40 of polymorphic toxin system
MDDYDQLLDEKGISLQSPGLRERALRRDDALNAISLLSARNVEVLGGDVYLLREGKIRVAYANWSVKRLADESDNDYRKRSWERAREYIRSYPNAPDPADIPIFVIVSKGRH